MSLMLMSLVEEQEMDKEACRYAMLHDNDELEEDDDWDEIPDEDEEDDDEWENDEWENDEEEMESMFDSSIYDEENGIW